MQLPQTGGCHCRKIRYEIVPGFQAADTRGRKLKEGAREIRIHGTSVPVRATIEVLDGLSAHGTTAALPPGRRRLEVDAFAPPGPLSAWIETAASAWMLLPSPARRVMHGPHGLVFTGVMNGEFQALDANGTADVASLYGSYPLIRSHNSNLYALAGLDAKPGAEAGALPGAVRLPRAHGDAQGAARQLHDAHPFHRS